MSIVLPTRGEALELGKCLKRAARFAREHHGDCEVVVVDDGNHPDVDTVVRNWRDRFARCVLVRHNKERGCGTSARTGVLMAHGRSILVVEPGRAAGMDDLGTLLADLENGTDFVVASRRLPGSIVRRERGFLRRAAEASFLLWARLLVPVGVRDLFSGCYGLRRGAALTVARRSHRASSGYLLEWVALSQRSGMQVTECPGTFEFPEGLGRLRDLFTLLNIAEVWSIRRGLAGIRYSGPQPQQVLLQDTSFVKLDRAALLAGRDGRARS